MDTKDSRAFKVTKDTKNAQPSKDAKESLGIKDTYGLQRRPTIPRAPDH